LDTRPLFKIADFTTRLTALGDGDLRISFFTIGHEAQLHQVQLRWNLPVRHRVLEEVVGKPAGLQRRNLPAGSYQENCEANQCTGFPATTLRE
jgi:hypothetical protein